MGDPSRVFSAKLIGFVPPLGRECLVCWLLEIGFLPIPLVTGQALQPSQCGAGPASAVVPDSPPAGSEFRALTPTSFCRFSGGLRPLPFFSRTFHAKRCLGMSLIPLNPPAETKPDSIFLFSPSLQAYLSRLVGDRQHSLAAAMETELIGVPQRI